MSSPVLFAGFDGRSLMIEAPVLKRSGCELSEQPSGEAVLTALVASQTNLVVLGPRLPDMSLPEVIRRIREEPRARNVSIMVLLPTGEPTNAETTMVEAGANAALRRPLSPGHLEHWLVKLLEVPRRMQIRVPVRGQVVATPRAGGGGLFHGLSRNLSVNGLLLASRDHLSREVDVELEIRFEDSAPSVRALGRVVRSASEVGWPYTGYGIEFLLVPPGSREIISSLVSKGGISTLPGEGPPRIRTTVQQESWVYEILDPVHQTHGWQVEIRRAPREQWRPGRGSPFYVVVGSSPEAASAKVRAFVEGLV